MKTLREIYEMQDARNTHDADTLRKVSRRMSQEQSRLEREEQRREGEVDGDE